MQIVFLSVFSPFRGGIASFGEKMLGVLASFSKVIPINFDVQYPARLFPGRTQFLDGKPKEIGQRLAHPLQIAAWIRTVKEIHSTKPDVFVFAYWHPFFSPMLWFINRRLRKKGVRTCGVFHNVIAHDRFPFQHFLMRSLLTQTDVAITLSGATRSELNTFNPRNPVTLFHPITPIRAGQQGAFGWENRLNRRPVLLHFGLIRPYKGVDTLLKALDLIPEWWKKCTVVLAGENYLEDQDLFEGISPETRQHIIYENRFLSDAEAEELISLADVMVLPYRTASQSGIMSQALGAEKPVICSRLEGLTEYVVENKTGWFFEPENVADLAMKINLFTAGSIQADEKALKQQREKYSWEMFARRLQEHLGSQK